MTDVMRAIRAQVSREELDYLFLMGALGQYKNPRDKLTQLLKKGELIRVKKGIYLFGEAYRNRPYSLEVLSNLIYGPSYLSFEYALAFYNLIPEQVTRVTAATCKRAREFSTPVGEFAYHHVSPKRYLSGVTWESIDEEAHFLIATPEKALADLIARIKPFKNRDELYSYIVEGLRIDSDTVKGFRRRLLEEIATQYENANVRLLCQV